MRINKKGMTVIETILSFVLITIVTVGLFNIVLDFKMQRLIVSTNEDINKYRTIVTSNINEIFNNGDNLIADTNIVTNGSNKEITIKNTDNTINRKIITSSNKIAYTNSSGVIEREYLFPNSNVKLLNTRVNQYKADNVILSVIKIELINSDDEESVFDITFYLSNNN